MENFKKDFVKSMGIIKSSEIFQGNILEKNEQRLEMIEYTKRDINLLTKIKHLFENINECNLQDAQYIIENELFYERVSINTINKYINKFGDINDFKYAYRLKAKNGFRRTMDYLVRKKH
ncbi:hypothetical protein RZ897_013740 [Clostridioides difficile]|uniref:hypothetical protein n=1 Tax=Clostridioides difficile TaxID=1496 RepID=UPI00016C5BE3|nr:hypothetical protein [Clostridioides difficile]OFU08132.1 hypothetical protein HMPREF3083_04225 [Clostridium sp. HMSC19D07]EQH27434.1 hypothetical protein QM1_1044 [Clostridioides difficile DA00212]MCE4722413.1 hypothetical protein [Clostridioides difficile]MCF8919722.1 hypothetical protein [Clostridioides difficile]MCG3580287.1 hypothetical protein [Clostridioides difficile]